MSKKTSKGRPQQPKCPGCKKALYKRMDSGQVKKADPYAWCRNKKCIAYNSDQSSGATRFQALNGVQPEPEPFKAEVDFPAEPEAVSKARARIRSVLDATEAKFGSNAVGLALAIVSQETGNHEAANALINEYKLAEQYGIQPR